MARLKEKIAECVIRAIMALLSRFLAHLSLRLDKDIISSVVAQSVAGEKGKKELTEARKSIALIKQQMKQVHQEAKDAQNQLLNLTETLRPLDNAKQHLTASITALTRLHSIHSTVEQLPLLLSQRKYADIAQRCQVSNTYVFISFCLT